jgi:hypothetical protein
MKDSSILAMQRRQRCALYTRKSTEEGLEQEFNSLDAQREACEGLSAFPAPRCAAGGPGRILPGRLS